MSRGFVELVSLNSGVINVLLAPQSALGGPAFKVGSNPVYPSNPLIAWGGATSICDGIFKAIPEMMRRTELPYLVYQLVVYTTGSEHPTPL